MKMIKNLIAIFGFILCVFVTMLNIIYIANVSNTWQEVVTFNKIGFIESLLIAIIVFLTIIISKFINKISLKFNENKIKICVGVVLITYALLSIMWIFYIDSYPIADSLRVYEAACELYDKEPISHQQYFELYPQNLTLAYVFSKIFIILHSKNIIILKIINIIANCFTILGLCKIQGILEKKYQANKSLLVILSFSYIPIMILVNFIYGDLISLPLTLFSVYYLMKYIDTNRILNIIISSMFMMMSITLRMNNLIFVIASIFYLILNLGLVREEKISTRGYIKKILLIILFVTISILPYIALKNILVKRYALDPTKSFPVIGFIAMGMEEGERANGWYKEDTASIGFTDIDNSQERYREIIYRRIDDFKDDFLYGVIFYIKKVASMWTDPLQESIWQSLSFNTDSDFLRNKTEEEREEYKKHDIFLINNQIIIKIYEKSVLIIIFGGTTFFILKNRKNVSNEIVFLLLCFIGGMMFHILWEAKSRYIISYILVLIPIASLEINRKKEEKEF